MSPQFKSILQRIAEALFLRTEIAQSIWMNKMRSTITMELMYWNTKMIQSCYNIYNIGYDIIDPNIPNDDDDI